VTSSTDKRHRRLTPSPTPSEMELERERVAKWREGQQ
jgi:hypothetical protein